VQLWYAGPQRLVCRRRHRLGGVQDRRTSGILGLEYQYVDLGEREHCPFGCRVDLPGVRRIVDVTASVLKAKFTLKFDGPPLLPF
jgi:hypothetical protein